jgi:hypothetical protein
MRPPGLSTQNDEMLFLAVAERDMGAFRTLYGRHAGWLAIRLARGATTATCRRARDSGEINPSVS